MAEETATQPSATTTETAQNAKNVECLASPAKMSDSDIDTFVANPKPLLTENPGGGLPLTNRVRELAGSSSRVLPSIMELAASATPDQKSAIAAGLARIVYVCGNLGNNDAADYAAVIQSRVAGLGDPSFASAFQQASEDIKTAAVGPGQGGAAPGGGAIDTSSKTGGLNSYRYKGDGPLDTTSGTYTVGSVSPYTASSTRIISP